jgi:adenine-specific DNA-methyltransferase
MQIWDTLLGAATELDLLHLGAALGLGPEPRTAMGVLQHLLRHTPRPADLVRHLSDDTVCRAASAAHLGELPAADARAALLQAAGMSDDTDWLMVEAPRRKPRLAWQGMHSKPAITSVPTQVMEVVSPRLAQHRDDRQGQLDGVGVARALTEARTPVNRLIWTNDNLVALRTLLDERDPVTRDWRYRGKVDLIYIDPPFMVNNDFVADNSISIDLDGAEGVAATKEPSLVEILAYKDTWREGLDSFLSMLRARLVLLKELLAPTGSIYVHMDWHASHYVKVLMDEIFGYDNYTNEIVWKRTTSRAGTSGINHIHDVLLSYRAGEEAYSTTLFTPYEGHYIQGYYNQNDVRGRFQGVSLTAPGTRQGETGQVWRGIDPNKLGRHWSVPPSELDNLDADDRIFWPDRGGSPRLKQYLHEMEGVSLQSIWMDIPTVNSQAAERLGYPTQKPVALLERIISASCPPNGLVLDCFLGSGTTAEAAERLGRRWIGIDNGKYSIHLARKRLIQLHNQPRPPEREDASYVECEACKNIERKVKKGRSPGPFQVRPFSVESMGVYLRAEAWLSASGEVGGWRTEMVKVFGGEPVSGHQLLHGRDGRGWIHVGPLDAPVPMRQAWSIAREAAGTDLHRVTILSADLDTLPSPEREEIRATTGVTVTLRIIPRTAIEQVALRLKRGVGADGAVESMAVPAFYTPLSIGLRATVDGPRVKLSLERCEVDVQSFLASQRPALKVITEGMPAAARKRAEAEHKKWEQRQAELEAWLAKASTWQQFVDFWAVDWDYADHLGPDGKPVFDTDWQSFRIRRGKNQLDPLVLVAESRYDRPGRYQVAARVTDVFGNDGISVVDVEVGR